jgi:tripartite-type tricarboxylate transporter receptor subunit TctC
MAFRLLARGLVAGALLCWALAQAPASAQKLSDQPIVIVVPFTAGTGIDILARITGEELQARWGQSVVVENKPGASGNIGTQYAAQRPADGHTLMMTVNTFVMNVSLFKSLPYDPQRSFAPIIEMATGAVALAVNSTVPANSVPELIDYAKANPGKINYASPGRGTPQHLAMELFKLSAGVDLVHVAYSGSAGAVRDLVGGHIGAMFIPVHTGLPLAADKQIKLLAIGSAQRSALAPDVPTLAQAGVSGFEVDLWYGLLAPVGTPPDIIARFNTVLNEMLATPKVKEALQKQGLVASGGPPEQLSQLIAKDQARWAKVVKDANIAAE